MAVTPGNIGKARVEVFMLQKSPFINIPKQEWSYFFTDENLNSMSDVSNIGALPPPVYGYRLSEKLENYDNFLQDSTGVYLEDATATAATGVISVDDSAKARAALSQSRRPIDGSQRLNFTWQLLPESIFQGKKPTRFSDMFKASDSSPKWTYNLKPKPDGNKQAELLTPFMTQATKDPKIPVHWGAATATPIALNQPFEILFYHDGQTHSIAQEAPSSTDRFGLKLPPIGIDLTKKAYVAIRFGDADQQFMLLFAQGFKPLFLGLERGVRAFILDVFEGFNGEALFTPNNTYFQCKIEPARTGFIINIASQQFSTPWIVQGPSNAPYLLRSGRVELYSGNVTAGFAIRPVQYVPTGSFVTPETILSRITGDDRDVECTTAVKGVSVDQSRMSKDANGNPVLYAVDAEKVGNDPVTSVIVDQAETKFEFKGNRRIDIEVIEETEDDDDPNAQPPALPEDTPAPLQKSSVSAKVTLTATDTIQPSGYVVANGRSPYIWQLRFGLDAEEPSSGSSDAGTDISCDVMSVDLSHNSTSLNEINHSGTIKVLNRPKGQNSTGTDYNGFMDRAIYFKIFAYWDDGVGHDPGGEDRQIFEGMSVEATVETVAEREVVVFKVEDYMNALEGGKFVLSPYYDGMSARAAIRDIAKIAGLPDSRILADDTPIPANPPPDPKEYGLPFANPFQDPQFRFKDGSSYKSAMSKIATLDGKTICFDHKGRFHYDTIAGGLAGSANATAKVEFFSSPKDAPEGKNCVWNVRSFSRKVNDTYNVIQVSTVDRDTGAAIHIAEANEAAIHDPGATGYLGYRKHLMIREPALGGFEAAARYFATYREIIFKPPLTARMETYGYSGLRPLDVIKIDGQLMRVLNISSHMSAQENAFWMNIEGEWFFPSGKEQNFNLAPS